MSGTTGHRRKRRSSAELERLEAARRARAEQLERERENERRVDAALGPFAEAATEIDGVIERRDAKLAALERQCEEKLAALERQKAAKVAEFDRLKQQVHVAAAAEIATWRAVMARSVHRIRNADVTVSQAAQMLAVSVREVTALAREGDPSRAPNGDQVGEADGLDADADTEAAAGQPVATDEDGEDRALLDVSGDGGVGDLAAAPGDGVAQPGW